jgi:hypothetical protein
VDRCGCRRNHRDDIDGEEDVAYPIEYYIPLLADLKSEVSAYLSKNGLWRAEKYLDKSAAWRDAR